MLGKIPQNHVQNSQPNDINDTNDILRTSQDFLYSCYHCDDFHTNSEKEYELHVASKHITSPSDVNHPCYPTKADLERLGLKAQGKSWEI